MTMTERQQKWFATAIANLEADTGRSMQAWIDVARACPETKHKARLRWFKELHGLGMNRASIILAQMQPGGPEWQNPDALLDQLWTDPAGRAIYDAVSARVLALPDVVVGPRKGFVGFSRKVQFAAIKPVKGGQALLGLDVEPQADPRLLAPGRQGWSERLKSVLPLACTADVVLDDLLRQAWGRAV